MMEKTLKKIKTKDESDLDLEYWLSKSDTEKLSIIQELRIQYIKLFNRQKEYDESRKRLRRIYRVIKNK